MPGAGHGDVVEAAGSIWVFAFAGLPFAVKHEDVVEFEALGAVGGEQEQAILPLAAGLAPFVQPVAEPVQLDFRTLGFFGKSGNGFLEAARPANITAAIIRTGGAPLAEDVGFDQGTVGFGHAQQGLGFA